MTKITLDRLPKICNPKAMEDYWDGLSPKEQKEMLLDIHDGVLDDSHKLLQLILEIEE